MWGTHLLITPTVAPKLSCGYGGLSGSLWESVAAARHVIVDESGPTTWALGDRKFARGVVVDAAHINDPLKKSYPGRG